MKVTLSRKLIADDGGLPHVSVGYSGIDISDMLVINYENLREAYIMARDSLIDAYKKAGGNY